jgi:hypothetical protein
VVAPVLALVTPARALAQGDRLALPMGTRVRVYEIAGERLITGNVLRLTPDSSAVAVRGRWIFHLPTSRLTSLEVSEGRDRLGSAGKGAGNGLPLSGNRAMSRERAP